MATVTIVQKVKTVNNSDTDINAEITTENADGFSVISITISGSNIILLLMKTTSTA